MTMNSGRDDVYGTFAVAYRQGKTVPKDQTFTSIRQSHIKESVIGHAVQRVRGWSGLY